VKVCELSSSELARRLRHAGIYLRVGPFITHLRSPIPTVAEGIHRLYADHALADNNDFADFHISLTRPADIRRWFGPQVVFSFDGFSPFRPLPLVQAFPMFEWTLNWCIANHSNQYLILHAASIEKDGYGAILPGPPGSGKSTLCAALVNHGWRLLSDELALVRLRDGQLIGLARPANLKNESIDIIKEYAPGVTMGRVSKDTIKGTVAHMKPPLDSVEHVADPASPAWVIFPKYRANEATHFKPRSKACTFIYAAENSFNYSHLGLKGFQALESVIDSSDCYDFTYSDLDEAVALFNALPAPHAAHNSAPLR